MAISTFQIISVPIGSTEIADGSISLVKLAADVIAKLPKTLTITDAVYDGAAYSTRETLNTGISGSALLQAHIGLQIKGAGAHGDYAVRILAIQDGATIATGNDLAPVNTSYIKMFDTLNILALGASEITIALQAKSVSGFNTEWQNGKIVIKK